MDSPFEITEPAVSRLSLMDRLYTKESGRLLPLPWFRALADEMRPAGMDLIKELSYYRAGLAPWESITAHAILQALDESDCTDAAGAYKAIEMMLERLLSQVDNWAQRQGIMATEVTDEAP